MTAPGRRKGEGRGAGGPAPPRRPVRSYAEVTSQDRSDLPGQIAAQRRRLSDRLEGVGALVPVVSGKGGVGKSAVTANLAVTLAARGARVGVVDADLNGPCLARMLGFADAVLEDRADGVHPATSPSGVKGISAELLLDHRAPMRWKGPASDRFLWQGAAETAVLREFLSDVVWGDLDYLLVDVPPGTDKIGRFLDLVPGPDQVLLVTTPSAAARAVVARSATFLADAGLSRAGVVRNMAGYLGSGAAAPEPLFTAPGDVGAEEGHSLEILVEIPFDPRLATLTDAGRPPGSDGVGPVGEAFATLAERVEAGPGGRKASAR